MRWDAFDFAALAEQYGTPFYLYDMDAAAEHLAAFRAHLPDSLHVMYCAKANANAAVLRAFRELTGHLDISSVGEMRIARAAGYEASAMSFAGPGKDAAALGEAVDAGVGLISLESAAELRRLVAICRARGSSQAVTLRINPQQIAAAFMMRMGGRASQFGVPEEEAAAVIEEALAAPELQLRGIHVFAGTQCLDGAAVVANIEQTLAIAAQLASDHGVTWEVVNLGGGLGVPYFAGDAALDPRALSVAIGDAVRRFVAQQASFAATRFFLELGRYLVGPFGVYVTRVIEVKHARGKRFVILDGGMHHCFPATGNFGQVVKKNYPIANISAGRDRPRGHFELVGPLCTPLDSMARQLELPQAEPGDLIAFASSGAYSYAASPLLFLGYDTPAELVHHRAAIALARPRRAAESFA